MIPRRTRVREFAIQGITVGCMVEQGERRRELTNGAKTVSTVVVDVPRLAEEVVDVVDTPRQSYP